MPDNHGVLHYFAHLLDRAFEVEVFTWAHVQSQDHSIQFFFAMRRQVLADQAVDVFVATALPGAVRVAEVDRCAGSLGDLCVPCRFPALVVGHALAHRQRYAVELWTKVFHRRRRRRVVHLHQHQVVAGTLAQVGFFRSVGLALDQVALPMARRQSIFDFRWSHLDTDHVGDLTAPIRTARAWSARALDRYQLLTQLAHRQRVDGVVDRLATDSGGL